MTTETEWIVSESWCETRLVRTLHDERKADYFHAAPPRRFGDEEHARAFVNRATYAAPWLPPGAHLIEYHISRRETKTDDGGAQLKERTA